MTIDEAIKYADLMSRDELEHFDENVEERKQVREFGSMCADALRLAKKMNKAYGLEEQND